MVEQMKQVKIIFCRGLIASGKSFWSKEFVKNHQDWKRICRDDLRHMLSSYSFDDKNEKLVTIIEENMIKLLIEQGTNIIIDSMNLNKQKLQQRIDKYVHQWKEQGIEIITEIKNFPVTLEEAITRDKLRPFVIGEKVIRRIWHRYKNELVEMLNEKYPKVLYNKQLSDAVIVDIDGTLCLNESGRNPYDYSRVMEDSLNLIINEQLIFHKSKNRNIIIVSGRDDSNLELTKQWLNKNNVIYDYIYFRKTGDKRKDSIIKEEIYNKYIKNKFNIISVFDDRPSVIKRWRELGLFVFDCGLGIDF